jgi:hypothetical protein
VSAQTPSEADKATARRLLDQGDEAMKAGDAKAAHEHYKAADELMKVPTTGVERARAEIAVGMLLEAETTLLRVTRYPRSPSEPGAFTQARSEATKMYGELQPRIPSLGFELSGIAEGVEPSVTVDGAKVSSLAVPRPANPGEHAIHAEAPGYKPIDTTITLAEAEKKAVTLAFEVDPNAPAAAAASTAAAKPSPAATPAPSAPAPPPTSPPPADSGSGLSPLVWVGFGVGAAGMVVGGITGAMSLSESSSLEDECGGTSCPPDRQDDIDSALTVSHVSTIGFAVGGAGIVVGVVGLLISGSGDDRAAGKHRGSHRRRIGVELEPMLGVGSAGLRGRF